MPYFRVLWQNMSNLVRFYHHFIWFGRSWEKKLCKYAVFPGKKCPCKKMNLFAIIELWILKLRNLSFRLLSFVDRNKMSVEFYIDIWTCRRNFSSTLCFSRFYVDENCYRNFARVFKMSMEFSVDILLLPFSCRQKFLSTSY